MILLSLTTNIHNIVIKKNFNARGGVSYPLCTFMIKLKIFGVLGKRWISGQAGQEVGIN